MSFQVAQSVVGGHRQVNRKLQHRWKHYNRGSVRCQWSTEVAHQIEPGNRDGLRKLPGGRDRGEGANRDEEMEHLRSRKHAMHNCQ